VRKEGTYIGHMHDTLNHHLLHSRKNRGFGGFGLRKCRGLRCHRQRLLHEEVENYRCTLAVSFRLNVLCCVTTSDGDIRLETWFTHPYDYDDRGIAPLL
jgi:hypothetical protein